jgi:hypothetical protein
MACVGSSVAGDGIVGCRVGEKVGERVGGRVGDAVGGCVGAAVVGDGGGVGQSDRSAETCRTLHHVRIGAAARGHRAGRFGHTS